MAKVKVFIHQKFRDKQGNQYLTGDQEIEEELAKSARDQGYLGIYKKVSKKKKK